MRALCNVILAAGFSRRLGRSKALATLRGVSLLRSTLRAVDGLSPHPIVIIAPPRSHRLRHELRGFRVRVIDNRARASGQATSVKLGLEAARYCAGALLIPTDLPGLRRRELRQLIARWRSAPRRAVARNVGRRAGAPAILPHRLFAAARRALQGDTGLRDVLSRLPATELELLELPSAAVDVDTALDLAAARRDRRMK